MLRFAKSVTMGTLVGGGPLVAISLSTVLVTGRHDIASVVPLVEVPLGIAFVSVLLSTLVIGIPVFLTLKALKAESRNLYVLIGLVFGVAVSLAALLYLASSPRAQLGSWLLSLVGGASGAATAYTWWRSRRAC